jgi:hypothetical protein
LTKLSTQDFKDLGLNVGDRAALEHYLHNNPGVVGPAKQNPNQNPNPSPTVQTTETPPTPATPPTKREKEKVPASTSGKKNVESILQC